MKKIIFGSILSVFLIVSLSWITPVNVKAVESENEDLKEMLFDFVNTFSEDEDFKKFLNDSDIKTFSSKILNAESENKRDSYTEDLENLLKTRYMDLIERYMPSFEKIKEKIENINVNIDAIRNDVNQYKNYKLDVKSDKLSITKQKGESISGDAILINANNASIKIPGHGWVDEDFWDNILDFLTDLLLGITTVFEAVLLFLEVLALVFMVLDIIFGKITDIFYLMAEHIMCVIIYIAGIWFKIEIALMAIIKIVEFLSEVATVKVKSKNISFIDRVLSIFKQIQKRIDLIFLNHCHS